MYLSLLAKVQTNTTVINNVTNVTFFVIKSIFILQPTTVNVEGNFSKFNVYYYDHYIVNIYSLSSPR